MRVTVLVDNNTYIDEYYYGEPAACYYIEDEDKKILLDTGYSGICVENAQHMGIDLSTLDVVCFSHGHNDHTGGFAKVYAELKDPAQLMLVAHPYCFEYKRLGDTFIGTPEATRKATEQCSTTLSMTPVKISPHITFLGEIPVSHSFENRQAIGEVYQQEEWVPDKCYDDSALVYEGKKGLFIITGCSHSGICNIISYARKVCARQEITGILGGLHLLEDNARTQKTLAFLAKEELGELYPCHCVSFSVKAALHAKKQIHEVGVGLSLEVE